MPPHPEINEKITHYAQTEIRMRQAAIREEQDTLLNLISDQASDLQADLSEKARAEQVRARLAADITYFNVFSGILSSLPPDQKKNIHPSVKTHKMGEILTHVMEAFADDEIISTLASGKIPTSYAQGRSDESFPKIIRDERPEAFWGTSKPTYLSAAILTLYFELFKTKIKNSLLDSAIVHIAPLPAGISLDERSSYSFHSNIAFVHSGYAFGGQRFQTAKAFGPEDCSSWIEKATGHTGLDCSFATKDFYDAYSDPAHWLRSYYHPTQNLHEVTPGTIALMHWGQGGHGGILSEISGTDFSIFNCTRNVPNREGFGISDYKLRSLKTVELPTTEGQTARFFDPLIPVENAKLMFFNADAKLSRHIPEPPAKISTESIVQMWT